MKFLEWIKSRRVSDMSATQKRDSFCDIESLIVQGDLSRLSAQEKVTYYKKVCDTLGLNPFTKPFDYITLNGKLTLYARREATEQLRKIHNISIKISNRELIDDVYTVTAQATTSDARSDESLGAVNLSGLKGEAKANALMKCETKAKRRVTLSICGLGMLDESEVVNIPNARFDKINLETGEIISNKIEAPIQNVSENIIKKLRPPSLPIETQAEKILGPVGESTMADYQQLEFLTILYAQFTQIADWIDKCLEKLNVNSLKQLTVSQADKLIDKISEKYPDAMSFWENHLFLKQSKVDL
jgi:hypothetical protein